MHQVSGPGMTGPMNTQFESRAQEESSGDSRASREAAMERLRGELHAEPAGKKRREERKNGWLETSLVFSCSL